MDQAPDQGAGMASRERQLPIGEHDGAVVLATRSVLGEGAGDRRVPQTEHVGVAGRRWMDSDSPAREGRPHRREDFLRD